MKKVNYILWYFPLCFFVFLAIFMFVKFIFIFFFRAAYEPEFMFNLTPYYALSGVSNLHLLFLSLIVVIFNVYLHVKLNKRNLLFSFIPTGIMLTGLGLKIASGEMVISNFFNYLIFGCLLVIFIIDHKHTLVFPDIIATPKEEPIVSRTVSSKPTFARVEPQTTPVSVINKPLRVEGLDEILTLHKETLFELRAMLKDDLQRSQDMMLKLEKKSIKMDYLSKEVEERRKNLVEEEKLFRRRFISSLDEITRIRSFKTEDGLSSDAKTGEETNKQPTMLDDFLGSAALMEHGILTKVNRPFVELLGYDTDILLDKSLIDFVAPEGLTGIGGYYLKRLKGKAISTYKTIFLTSDNRKIRVKVTIKPIIYEGKKVDMVLVRNMK